MRNAAESVSHSQHTCDVFVSYASLDKAEVLPIVAALRGLGLTVWLDQDQIEGFFGDEITKAIGKSKVVLFFASPAAFRSNNTLTELTLARKKNKAIVPVYLEMTEPPDGFEYFLALAQYVNTQALAEDRWIPEICKKLQAWGVDVPAHDVTDGPRIVTPTILEQEERVLGASTPAFIGAHPLTPYLIDRRTQEGEIKDALLLHRKNYPRRPIVLLAHGDQEQALNEYVDRFHQYTLPKALSAMRADGYRDIVKRMDLPWLDQDWEAHPARTLARLKDELLERQGLTAGDWPRQFAAELAKFDSVPIICYHLHWENWNDSHLRTLKAWVLEWAALPDLPLGCPIILMIAIQQYAADARARFPFLQKPKSPSDEIKNLGKLTSSSLLVVPLTQLGNIRVGDVDDWIRYVVKPRDPSAMIKRFHDLLDDPTFFGAGGVPMSRFVDRAARTGAMDLFTSDNAGVKG